MPPPTAPRTEAIPPDIVREAQGYTLSQLLDLALRNSPITRGAWAAARSAAAAHGIDRGEYYPSVEIDAYANRAKSLVSERASSVQTSYGASVLLDYLLFDLGGRSARVEESRQALIAADWLHNASIQDVALAVEQTYFLYVQAKVLLEARQADVEEARTSLDAAEQRHAAGVATIADVLQARTALSQAQLELDTVEGQIQTVRGALATAVGVPANTPIDVPPLPDDLPVGRVSRDADAMIAEAEQRRPDLAAARSLVAKAESHVTRVRSDGRLSLGFSGQAGQVGFEGADSLQDAYSAGLFLRIPVFTGFSQRYKVLQAEADAERSRASLDALEQEVIYQVWRSYYALRTAEQRQKTAADLVAAATQSNEVALGRYRAGVGSIIDLLVAQARLSSARAQQITARAEWLVALAQLAHDTGTLWPPAAPAIDGSTRGTP
jgi:outer membrane protein TolC